MSNKYTKLIKNSGIFAIANLGSHLILFFLVRFYTEFLTTEEYGIIDVMVTSVSLIIPIITFAIVEAVLRFSMDYERPEDVFTNGFSVAVLGSICFAVIGPIFFANTKYINYYIYVAILVLLTSVDSICSQYVRGIGKVTIFALAGIIKTLTLCTFNILFLLCFKWKIAGYMLSIIISEAITVLFLIISSHLYKHIKIHFESTLLRQMIKYSFPLVPNVLSWWVMNASDKYTVALLLGISSNGLYAIAHKIPSLIYICNSLFFQAWQLSAVEESKNADKEGFFSNVFNYLAFFLFVLTSLLFIFLKPFTSIFVADGFEEAWRYSPFLTIGMIFSAFSSFLGTNYIAIKKSEGALKTTLTGAGVNIILNFILIKLIGLNGAALATMISFLVICIYRALDTKKYIAITYKFVPFILSTALLLSHAVLLIMDWKYILYYGIFVCLGITLLYINEAHKLLRVGFSIIRKVL